MKPKILFLKIALCGLLLVLATGLADAATLRGRLIHKNGYPATAIAVTLVNAQGVRCSPAYTGADGMYYLSNVPPGPYHLEIWIYPKGAPAVFQIQVREPLTDIAQIAVP